jgi:hypothetical protein
VDTKRHIPTTHLDDPRDEVVVDDVPTARDWSFSSDGGKVLLVWWFAFTLFFTIVATFGDGRDEYGEPEPRWHSWPLLALTGLLVARYCCARIAVSRDGLTIRRTFNTYDVSWAARPRFLLSSRDDEECACCVEVSPGRLIKGTLRRRDGDDEEFACVVSGFEAAEPGRGPGGTVAAVKRSVVPLILALAALWLSVLATEAAAVDETLPASGREQDVGLGATYSVVAGVAVLVCLAVAYFRHRRRRAARVEEGAA